MHCDVRHPSAHGAGGCTSTVLIHTDAGNSLRLESALLSFPSGQGLEVSVTLAGGCLPLESSGSTSRRPAATTLGMCRIGVVLLLFYFLSVTDESGLVLATQVTMNAAHVELA